MSNMKRLLNAVYEFALWSDGKEAEGTSFGDPYEAQNYWANAADESFRELLKEALRELLHEAKGN